MVLRATSSGLEVKGTSTATSGTIGGFTIGSTSIYSNGMSDMYSGQTYGVHVGTDGIKLGQNFKVWTNGNVEANNMTLTGDLTVGGYPISAYALRQGAIDGYNWNNQYQSAYGGTAANYAITGASGGYSFKNATDSTSGSYPYFFKCTNFQADSIFIVGQGNVSRGTISIPSTGHVTVNGNRYNIVWDSTNTKNVWVY